MNESNYVISVRNVKKPKGKEPYLGTEPGVTRYLEVPDGKLPHPEKHRLSQTDWLKGLLERAEIGKNDIDEKSPASGFSYGDILIFVHGYNNSMEVVMKRHNLLQKRLKEQGFKGAIVSFDWPSADKSLNYLEDRSDAKQTAHQLVKDGISILARNQLVQDRNKCDIDVHLLGHSTGAYVIREAFYEASQNRSISRVRIPGASPEAFEVKVVRDLVVLYEAAHSWPQFLDWQRKMLLHVHYHAALLN